MANPTTAFGWVMPNSADLVTDLPADFNVFGQGVDTSMQYLLGGTTGQVLSKTSATDMAFTWIANDVGDITGVTAGTGISGGGTSGTVTVTNSMATAITTAGDLIKGTGSGTFDRLGIGSTGNVLTVSGGAPVWSAPAGGGKVLQVVQGTTSTSTVITSLTYVDTNLSASITPTLATSKILVLVTQKYFLYTSAAPVNAGWQLLRGTTVINDYKLGSGLIYAAPTSSELYFGAIWDLHYLDSPATTTSTTYKTQAKIANSASSRQVEVNTDTTTSTMILMEIGA